MPHIEALSKLYYFILEELKHRSELKASFPAIRTIYLPIPAEVMAAAEDMGPMPAAAAPAIP